MTTNKDAFRNYLQLEKKYSPHTLTAYCADIACFELFNEIHFDDKNIDNIAYSQIRSWIVSLVDQGVATGSINRKVASLRAFYKFLLRTKQIQVSPLVRHKALKTSNILQIPFSEKEVLNVLDQMQDPVGFEQVRNKLIIDLLYTTGMRRAELIQLQMANISIENSTIKVLGKRNKERILPILPILVPQVYSYLQERALLPIVLDSAYFFLTKKGIKLNDSLVYRLINSYFSGVSKKVKKSPHIVRHTFATHLLNNGADLNSVKELLGHSSLASTQIYTHSSLSEIKNVYKGAHPRGSK